MRAAELRARRWAAQGLDAEPGSGRAPREIVRSLLAVQSQDLVAARRALRARGAVTAGDVDAALGAPLVVTWLMRGTLHLVGTDDLPWLHGLTAPTRFAASRRRLAQEGVPPDQADRAVAAVERALSDEGMLPRAVLAERIARAGVRSGGQATPHVLLLAALRGRVVQVSDGAGGLAFAGWADRLGAEAPGPLDGDARANALAELARRWLAAHGPATADDLARWAGLPLRDAREGLSAIAAELADHGGGLVALRAAGGGAPGGHEPVAPTPRLLPAFDPYVVGWRDRSFAVAERHARRVHPGAGVLRAIAAVDGRFVGTWTARRAGSRLTVAIEPFVRLARADRAALDADAGDVARFEGLSRSSG